MATSFLQQWSPHWSQYWHLWLLALILTLISVGFFWRFVLPARQLGRELALARASLAALRERTGGNIIELGEIARLSMSSPRLSLLWQEYAETLHPQRLADDCGKLSIHRWRASALAESFFTEQAIVDTPLRTGFYKHLPGILTGLGIIGTFTGLIMGLTQFEVSADPAQAQTELGNLINAVGRAFVISAVAITLAMLFTWIEKSLITARYQQVEDLRQLIDGLFGVGVGEEYLERLVCASETQARQAAHIKDALVVELREMLTELAERQATANARDASRIASEVGKSIAVQLGQPLGDIAEAVKRVGASQSEAINKMLTEVLASFAARLESLFGGQMHGMTDLLRQTGATLQATAERFDRLATQMDTSSNCAAQAMHERLEQGMAALEARQQIQITQIGEFIAQMHTLAANSQSEVGLQMQKLLTSLGEQVSVTLQDLRRQTAAVAAAQGEQQARFEAGTEKTIGSLSIQMESVLSQSTATHQALGETVARLTSAAEYAVTGMQVGGEQLHAAATAFARANNGVAETLQASSSSVAMLRESSQLLARTTETVMAIMADYGKTRDTFATMVAGLQSTVANARREASLTSEVVATLEQATDRLSAVQQQADSYLHGISAVLEEAHAAFAANVEKTLSTGNRQFQKEIGAAVALLSVSIKDLADTLDTLPTRQ